MNEKKGKFLLKFSFIIDRILQTYRQKYFKKNFIKNRTFTKRNILCILKPYAFLFVFEKMIFNENEKLQKL